MKLYTRHDLIDVLRSRGFRITYPTLMKYEREGYLVPFSMRKSTQKNRPLYNDSCVDAFIRKVEAREIPVVLRVV